MTEEKDETGWQENMIYPGTHWLYYDERHNYRARIDFNACTRGLYRWTILNWSNVRPDVIGHEATLEAAMSQADKVLANESVQLKLFV